MNTVPRIAEDSAIGRRRFLSTTAGATLGMAGPLAAARNPKPIRLGVAGGRFGNTFHYFADHPDCEVVAVTDLRPKRRDRMMEAFRCGKAYESLEEMVKASDIDAIAIFTDGNLHVDHTVKAMKHGKHVLCAVPAAWGSYERADLLYETVKSSGLTYMMARQASSPISRCQRRSFRRSRFGEIYLFESAYHHPGLEELYFENGSDGPPWEKGRPTWRHGFPPMFYPTHNIGYFTGITGERLIEVSCTGWGDGDPILNNNAYDNPFWNCYGQFVSDKGHTARIDICWRGPLVPGHPTRWNGTKMSFHASNQPQNALHPATLIHHEASQEKDSAGFAQHKNRREPFTQKDWHLTDLLPEPLRVRSGHCNSHPFICHEFIDSLKTGRRPQVHVAEALAYTMPGIVAHQSALRGGERMKIRHYDPI